MLAVYRFCVALATQAFIIIIRDIVPSAFTEWARQTPSPLGWWAMLGSPARLRPPISARGTLPPRLVAFGRRFCIFAFEQHSQRLRSASQRLRLSSQPDPSAGRPLPSSSGTARNRVLHEGLRQGPLFAHTGPVLRPSVALSKPLQGHHPSINNCPHGLATTLLHFAALGFVLPPEHRTRLVNPESFNKSPHPPVP
jgi:hypothetical protein